LLEGNSREQCLKSLFNEKESGWANTYYLTHGEVMLI
jgi:hypothetical protein